LYREGFSVKCKQFPYDKDTNTKGEMFFLGILSKGSSKYPRGIVPPNWSSILSLSVVV
jgi:hypothetical protein